MTKVLVVDDDPLIYHLYEKLLINQGFEVEVAENGQIGLDKIPNFQPDVILLDIMMPIMNGMDMLSKLKANPATSHIPVIVLTNVSNMGVASQALSSGANLSIVKSEIEPEQVVAAIQSVLEKASRSAPTPAQAEATAQTPAEESVVSEDSTINN